MKKKKKKKKEQLPFRINLLFFVIFLLFSLLILQLGVIQILNGEAYQDEIERTIKDTTKLPVPRGKIYDADYDVVVDDEPKYSITYTPPKGVQAEDRLELAQELAKYISMDSEEYLDKLTERDKKEYWYLLNKEEADHRADSKLSDEQKENMSNAEIYNYTLDLITEEEISNFSKEELEVIAIKKELDKAYSLTPQIIKNEDVTAEEYARVAENLHKLPGINATTDWDREYPYGESLKTLMGNITSEEEGIPAEKEDYFLTRGYARNDRVGTSGLEQQYEDVLRGRKEQVEYTTTKEGVIIDSETVVEGQRGKDLVLTIDMDFQQEVDKIVLEELQKARSSSQPFLTDAIAVVMDPKTGELLAVSGQHYNKETGEYENADYKALYDAHRPGSIVKGATMLAGYESGVISPGEVLYDRPIVLPGGQQKSSVSNMGPVDDLTALRRSSNVYMFYIALRIGGENRYPFPNGGSPQIDSHRAYQEMRNYFRQLGLGASTGIDYPYESTGYVGPVNPSLPGLFLDFAIGQYDTYTALQMAQYVSTIANDGYRVRPHFVKQIREPGEDDEKLGPVYKSYDTQVLNRIEMDQSYIERVQEGFRQAFQSPGGTGYRYYSSKDYNPAGKTGTAENEVYIDGQKYDTENLTLVGYAPYDDPEMAFAIVVPNTSNISGRYPITHGIATRIMDTYFNMDESSSEEDEEETSEEESDVE